MMKSPCKECITFAVCNMEIKQMPSPDVTQFSMSKDCDMLQSFLRLNLTREEHFITNKSQIRAARKAFGLPAVKPTGTDSISRDIINEVTL